MEYSCYRDFSVTHGWFIYWGFGWERCRLSKSSEIIVFKNEFKYPPLTCWMRIKEGWKVSSDWVILFGKNLFSKSNLMWSKVHDCYFLGVHIRLSTPCELCFILGLFANYFSLKSLSLSHKSHMICPKVKDCVIIIWRGVQKWAK